MFTTVTQVRCRPGRSPDVRDLCLSLLPEIRRDPGCVSVELYIDGEDPDVVVFIACWADEMSWREHIEAPRQRELAEQAASPEGRQLMEGWTSQHLHKISDLT